jgi:S1-C subfamily serine protease
MSRFAVGLVSGLIFGAIDAAVAADLDAKGVYSATRPSIVLITTSDATGSDIAVGTGFAVGDGKTIVTNLHVIREAASAKLRTANGNDYAVSYALGYDRVHDLALLESPVALPH